MNIVRLANDEEIAKVAETSDLSYATSVLTMDGQDFAVLRNCFEIDPMYFHPDSPTRRKLLFAMNLETALRLQGVKEIYFNVHDNDEQYQAVLNTWGAQKISTAPEFRYKKVL